MPQPEITFRHGPCSASVFVKEWDSGGETHKTTHVKFSKSYQDKNGEWKRTGQLQINDIPKAVIVLQKVYKYLTMKDSSYE